MDPISNLQRRTIFALAGELGMGEDLLHDLVFDVTAKTSIRELSSDDARAVIRDLNLRGASRPAKRRASSTRQKAKGEGPQHASEGQQRKVWALMYQLQQVSPSAAPIGDRLCGIIKKELRQDAFPKDPFAWIDYHKCIKLIDILKQYVAHAQKKEAKKHG